MKYIEAKRIVKALGMLISKTDFDDEYRVALASDDEASAYYTDDLDDAVGTARAMAQFGKGQHPMTTTPKKHNAAVKLALARTHTIDLQNDVYRQVFCAALTGILANWKHEPVTEDTDDAFDAVQFALQVADEALKS